MAGGSINVRLRAKAPYKETTGIESTVMNSGYPTKGKKKSAKPSKSKAKGKGALAGTWK